MTSSNPDRSGRPLAVITGGSSGIGAAFARRVAADHDVVLVARRPDRLASVRDELARDHPDGRFDTVTADLSTSDGTGAVVERLARGGVDLLVNNAGAGYHGRFVDEPSDRIAAEVALDCVAVASVDPGGPSEHGGRRARGRRQHLLDRRVPAGGDDGRVRRRQGIRALTQRSVACRDTRHGGDDPCRVPRWYRHRILRRRWCAVHDQAPFDSGSGGGRHAGRTPARQGSGGAGRFEQGVVAGLQVPTAKCDRPRIRMECESPMRHVPSAGHFDRDRQPDVK